ncbi:DUF4382 domain-containing protein [Candidatus Pacearchaeota archaeon]|nr:DUF4382 domain-containing protein [Candidatus Pacearchaeota archaeon]
MKKEFIWIIIIAVIILVAGYFFTSQKSGTGTLVLQITDAPPAGENVSSVIVRLSNVEVHKAQNTIEINNTNITSEAGWFTVVQDPVQYDLIAIKDVTQLLGTAELQSGKYTQIRLNVDSATAVINGQQQELTIPSKTIKLVRNFDIVAGETTTLTLDFDAEESINKQGNNQYRMNPTITIVS